MKKLYILFALIIIFTATTAYAAGKAKLLEVILLKADKIAVKANATFAGSIFNDTKTKGKDNPVTIKDNLSVTGTTTTQGLTVKGDTSFVGNFTAGATTLGTLSTTGTANVGGTLNANALASKAAILSSLLTVGDSNSTGFTGITGTGIVTPSLVLTDGTMSATGITMTINDNLRVNQNLRYDGLLFNGTTDITTRIDQNRDVSNKLAYFISCLHDRSLTASILKVDLDYCWNLYGVSTPSNPVP